MQAMSASQLSPTVEAVSRPQPRPCYPGETLSPKGTKSWHPALLSYIFHSTSQAVTMPKFHSLPLRHEPKSIHTYDISAASINSGLGDFTKATRSEDELRTWLSTVPTVQDQHMGLPAILRIMQVPDDLLRRLKVRTNVNLWAF
jgi:hypothetical protein